MVGFTKESEISPRNSTSSPQFDISHRSSPIHQADDRWFKEIDGDISVIREKKQQWGHEVKELISSSKWLRKYGLRNNHLDINQILSSLGFKLREKYESSLRQPVCSKYSNGLFPRVVSADGSTYNITSDYAKLKQVEKRLETAITLYQNRLDWLTTASRRTFGVIEEQCIAMVIDLDAQTDESFALCKSILVQVLREQVRELRRFNIIRVAEDLDVFKPSSISVTHDSLKDATEWIQSQKSTVPTSHSATCEAIKRALTDPSCEAVYLFTDGHSVVTSYETLHEMLVAQVRKLPVHIVTYNCHDKLCLLKLKSLSVATNTKMHSYAVIKEIDSYECNHLDGEGNELIATRKYTGGVPSGIGVREDAYVIFSELEEAKNVLNHIRKILQEMPVRRSKTTYDIMDSASESHSSSAPSSPRHDDLYMSSRIWLSKYGIYAKNLSFPDYLKNVAFQHRDGVIDTYYSSSQNGSKKSVLVNAKYCEKFPVVRWKDGQVMHVQVTPDVARKYEEKMHILLDKIQRRIQWLQQGSRELFGTVVEQNVYILIDISASMSPHINFIKEKLLTLMQEQLRHKSKFNIICYETRTVRWQEKLTEVTEQSLQDAWMWIQNITCHGSTNVYAALQLALSDEDTEAIYLLTDGRPDQPPKSIIAQIQLRNIVPVHTISFNCDDTTANDFLRELASVTHGRYHYYHESNGDFGHVQTHSSEDIRLLAEEYMEGVNIIERMKALRDECSNLCWKSNYEASSKSSKTSTDEFSNSDLGLAASRSMKSVQRPRSAPPSRSVTRLQCDYDHTSPKKFLHTSRLDTQPLTASHTRTSILRLLYSAGRYSPDTWLLPETEKLFNRQKDRQETFILKEERKPKVRKQIYRHKRINNGEMHDWLDKHGLVAKKLTILDALAPTVIPHRAKFVPILDKYVQSEVFNEVLPLAHVSRKKRQEISLVNPNGVDLLTYEDKLKEAISLYKRHLNQLIWPALPEDIQLRFDKNDPDLYSKNKKEITAILLSSDSTVNSNKHISLLSKEIKRGEKYYRLSQSLRKNSRSTDHSKNSPPDLCSADDDIDLYFADSGKENFSLELSGT